MHYSFTTDGLSAADRLQAWASELQRATRLDAQLDLIVPALPFCGSLEVRSLGVLDYMCVSATGLRIARSQLEIARQPNDPHYLVITQLKGRCSGSHNDAELKLEQGDSTVVDGYRPLVGRFEASVHLLLSVPRRLLETRLDTPPLGKRICGRQGLGAILYRMAASIYAQAETLDVEQGIAAAEAILNLISGYTGRSVPGSPDRASSEVRNRAQRYIENHLPEPDLNPTNIAAGCGISMRHLYRLLSLEGLTVGDLIRDRRLEQCRRDLSDRRLHDLSITDIAFRWGFNDSSHFARCFKQKYGVSPRLFRLQATISKKTLDVN